MKDKFEEIIRAMTVKAVVKQAIYRSTCDVFAAMMEYGEELTNQIRERFKNIDENVPVEFRKVSRFEFHMRISGDLLAFSMHTNVISLPKEHIVYKNPYVREMPERGYFGQIFIFNFMADSIQYNRLNDPGYLIARMLINGDQKFFLEGVRPLEFLYPDISKNQVSKEILRVLIEDAFLIAIDQDLSAPNFQQIQRVTLGQQMASQQSKPMEKVGFNISAKS